MELLLYDHHYFLCHGIKIHTEVLCYQILIFDKQYPNNTEVQGRFVDDKMHFQAHYLCNVISEVLNNDLCPVFAEKSYLEAKKLQHF